MLETVGEERISIFSTGAELLPPLEIQNAKVLTC